MLKFASRPELECQPSLFNQHTQPRNGVQTSGTRTPGQQSLTRVVDQIVDTGLIREWEGGGPRGAIHVRKHANRGCVDNQVYICFSQGLRRKSNYLDVTELFSQATCLFSPARDQTDAAAPILKSMHNSAGRAARPQTDAVLRLCQQTPQHR